MRGKEHTVEGDEKRRGSVSAGAIDYRDMIRDDIRLARAMAAAVEAHLNALNREAGRAIDAQMRPAV